MREKDNSTHWFILAGLILAVTCGFLLRNVATDTFPGSWTESFIEDFLGTCAFVGNLFIRALKMLIVPLIVSAVVSGIGGLSGVAGLARLGTKTLFLYLLTGFLAVSIGLGLVNLIQPGLENGQPSEVIQSVFRDADLQATPGERARFSEDSQEVASDYTQLFKRMIPLNIVSAASDNGQVLGIIVFSILFGAAIVKVDTPEVRSLQTFIKAIHDVMIQVTFWIMKIAPIGVFALIVPVVYRTGGELFLRLGLYFFTVLSALGLHFLVVMPLLLLILGKVNPWKHLIAMRSALLMAFSTASSAATLPVTMRSVEKAGISKKTSSFTLPLGATVNMDGTALYECVAVLFVAQVMGLELSFTAQFVVAITALLTSIGVAGVPSASLVAILLIMKSSGIPGAETAVVSLLAVDRLLDMSRTAVNIYGDSCVAAIIDKSEK